MLDTTPLGTWNSIKNDPKMCLLEWKAWRQESVQLSFISQFILATMVTIRKAIMDILQKQNSKLELKLWEFQNIRRQARWAWCNEPMSSAAGMPADTDHEQTLVWGCLGSGPHHLLLKRCNRTASPLSAPHTHQSPVSITPTLIHPLPCQPTYLIGSF